MQLVVDIGNTQAKLAAFEGSSLVEAGRTEGGIVPPRLASLPYERAIVACVAEMPDALEAFIESLACPVLRFEPATTPLPLRSLRYTTPETLGADRIAAVVGAMAQRPGKDILVIDAGTCITYDYADKQGNYLGGNISPGLALRLRSMAEMTARLPLVEASGPAPEAGTSTETAIRSGAVLGIKHEIDGYVRRFAEAHSHGAVFFTGGGLQGFETMIIGHTFATQSKSRATHAESLTFVTDTLLVSRGLNTILQYNT